MISTETPLRAAPATAEATVVSPAQPTDTQPADTQPSDTTTRQRIYFLDGLRGIAALFVVTFHTATAFTPGMTIGGTSPIHTPVDSFLRVAPILGLPFRGNFAVCVFFVLSGTALALGPLTRASRLAVVSAVVRRAPRLMIPALGATLIAWLLWTSGAFDPNNAGRLANSGWFREFWSGSPTWYGPWREATAGIVLTSIPHVYIPVLWTMHWELVGSMLVFAVLVIMPPRPVRFVLYALGVVVFWQSYLLDFVAGLAICDAWLALGQYERLGQPTPRWRWWVFGSIGAYGLVLGSCPSPYVTDFYRQILPGTWNDDILQAHLVGAALLLVGVMALGGVQRVLSTRVCRFLGRISFSLYLLHFLILGSIGAEVFSLGFGHLPYPVLAALTGAVVVGCSLAASYLFTRAVDEPAVRLLGRLHRLIMRLPVPQRLAGRS